MASRKQLEAQARDLEAEFDAIVRRDLRDEFAKAAMGPALTEFYRTGVGAVWASYDDLAEHIYNVADAMLAEREKGGA